ncbi:MAG: NADH-quinone oxidoreductase subunit J [Pseudomonadota bacterium]
MIGLPMLSGAALALTHTAIVAGAGAVGAAGAAGTAGIGETVLFWLFALIAVGGALGMITRRNVVAAVMCLVATIVALAGLYVLLLAQFLAVIQVIVYAGAIMVLFVFVIMMLNKEDDAPWALRGLLIKVLAGGGLAYLMARVGSVVWDAGFSPERAWNPGQAETFGSIGQVGQALFTDYLFPFEAVSLVLLVAVVGALVLANPRRPGVAAAADSGAAARIEVGEAGTAQEGGQ